MLETIAVTGLVFGIINVVHYVINTHGDKEL